MSVFGSKTSTETLGRHKSIKLDNSIQHQITPYFKKKDISKEHFLIITEELVNFAAEDMRPFTAVEGYGFMKFCHTLVNDQNKYASPIDISNSLSGREAVSSGVKRRASSVRDQITNKLSFYIIEIGRLTSLQTYGRVIIPKIPILIYFMALLRVKIRNEFFCYLNCSIWE